MRSLWWMVGASLGSWLALAPLLEAPVRLAVLAGMLGPLVMAVATGVAIDRAHRRNPERVTAVMVGAFGGKVLFVGAYVAIVLRGLSVRPVPFVASFTSYFIALYVMEALHLRRLFAGGASAQS